jgi:hypothetical protein
MWSVTLSTTSATPTTAALPGSVVTDAPIGRIPGPHNDGSDFYGIGLGLLAILAAIAFTRLVFRRRGRSRDAEGTR